VSDDKTKTARDAHFVNVNQRYELRAWCAKFKCTEQALRFAVQLAGPQAKAVGAVIEVMRRVP
jgi:hypothetical protein